MSIDASIVRSISIIKKSISRLRLDLKDLEILTEVGSNNYIYTPIIAALAGAKKVNAWTHDTQYGYGEEIAKECKEIAEYCNVKNCLEISVNTKPLEHISTANIITNSGFIRPINEEFLKHVNPDTCVIPLMYEAWELRATDIDIEACKRRGIRTAGTWENHPEIKVFDAVGPLAVKLAMEAGFEVYGNKIIVWSEDGFGEKTAQYFKNMNAQFVIRTTSIEMLYEHICDSDFIYFCNYSDQQKLIGENGVLDAMTIKNLNPSIGIIHLYGDIETNYISKLGIQVFPPKQGRASVMSESLAYLGPTPVINLLTAGFKVGECLFKNDKNDILQEII